MRSRVLALAVSLALVAAAATALAGNPWEGRAPYGLSMMTEEEREAYWNDLRALSTVEEQQAYWLAHIEKMKQRALERGVELPPPPRRIIPDELQPRHPRPPYFPDIMTDEEIRVYEETLMGLQDLDERKAFIAQNLKKMQERALARGVSMPATGAYADVLPYLDGADVTEVEEDTAEQDQAAAGKDAESDGESAALDDEEDE
jgi:hypothetical protein